MIIITKVIGTNQIKEVEHQPRVSLAITEMFIIFDNLTCKHQY